MRVIKVGGAALRDDESIRHLAREIANEHLPLVIVHGGGPKIDQVQEKLGSPVQKVDGLRITNKRALRAAVMALCGEVNKSLVAALLNTGVNALGISGVDGSLIRVRQQNHPVHDLGFVGEVVEVNAKLIHVVLKQGLCPVIAPLSIGPDGQIFNVNADQVACAIAIAVSANELQILTDTSVLSLGKVQTIMDAIQVEKLIEQKEILGGMIPKVRAGIHALEHGVARVQIGTIEGIRDGTATLLSMNGSAP